MMCVPGVPLSVCVCVSVCIWIWWTLAYNTVLYLLHHALILIYLFIIITIIISIYDSCCCCCCSGGGSTVSIQTNNNKNNYLLLSLYTTICDICISVHSSSVQLRLGYLYVYLYINNSILPIYRDFIFIWSVYCSNIYTIIIHFICILVYFIIFI